MVFRSSRFGAGPTHTSRVSENYCNSAMFVLQLDRHTGLYGECICGISKCNEWNATEIHTRTNNGKFLMTGIMVVKYKLKTFGTRLTKIMYVSFVFMSALLIYPCILSCSFDCFLI